MKIEKMVVPFDVKNVEEDDEHYFYFEGYASTFGNLDCYRDTVMPGAFKESIKLFNEGKKRIKVLWHHKLDEPIGVPVFLKEDKKGLFVRAKLPKADTFVSKRVIPQLKVGSVDQMSIGYELQDYTAVKGKAGEDGYYELNKINLMEFSPVSIPADTYAVITSLKSLDDFDTLDERTLEKSFREGIKLSRQNAKKLISYIKQAKQRDAEEANRRDADTTIEEEIMIYNLKQKLIKALNGGTNA